MKKILTLLVLASVFAISCQDAAPEPDPDPEPQPLVVNKDKQVVFIEFSAAWCPPCGAWGNDRFLDFINANKATVVPWSIHGSSTQPDGMTTGDNNAMKTNYPITGWPNFSIANKGTGTASPTSGDISTALGTPIIAQVGYKVTESADAFDIEYRVEFFEDVTGEYSVAFYALEDGIPGADGTPSRTNAIGGNGRMDQAGDNSTTYTHNHVYQGSATEGVWGKMLVNGSVTAGDDFRDLTTSVAKNLTMVSENVHIVAVIWEKTSPGAGAHQYKWVNANNRPIE